MGERRGSAVSGVRVCRVVWRTREHAGRVSAALNTPTLSPVPYASLSRFFFFFFGAGSDISLLRRRVKAQASCLYAFEQVITFWKRVSRFFRLKTELNRNVDTERRLPLRVALPSSPRRTSIMAATTTYSIEDLLQVGRSPLVNECQQRCRRGSCVCVRCDSLSPSSSAVSPSTETTSFVTSVVAGRLADACVAALHLAPYPVTTTLLTLSPQHQHHT